MKTTIVKLEFPCEIKDKLKMKVSSSNLKFKLLSGHILSFNKTNLSVTEPHKIIVSNSNYVLVALLYDNSEKVYLPSHNVIISFTKYVNILNQMNKSCTKSVLKMD